MYCRISILIVLPYHLYHISPLDMLSVYKDKTIMLLEDIF